MFVCKTNYRMHCGLVNRFCLRGLQTEIPALQIWSEFIWGPSAVVPSSAPGRSQHFQPLRLSTSHFQKQRSLKYKGVVFASHPRVRAGCSGFSWWAPGDIKWNAGNYKNQPVFKGFLWNYKIWTKMQNKITFILNSLPWFFIALPLPRNKQNNFFFFFWPLGRGCAFNIFQRNTVFLKQADTCLLGF